MPLCDDISLLSFEDHATGQKIGSANVTQPMMWTPFSAGKKIKDLEALTSLEPFVCGVEEVHLHAESGTLFLKKVYVLTQEEAKVIKQCNSDSFWFRSVPFSVMGMTATQVLISRGFLTTHSRFGALPKVAFAGTVGFMAGKLSYYNACKEKILKLENSPLAEMLHQGRISKLEFPGKKAPNGHYNDDDITTTPSFSSEPPLPEQPYSAYSSNYESSPADVPFSASMSDSSPTGISDNIAQEPELQEEQQAKAPSVTYSELRKKHRDSVISETPVRSRAPRTEGKKNKYGDVWEE
ncbi:PREDICTED: OCIA domain-containing protein 1 [Nanorana parkeri]|uniref:OCIA domain-containing protein 1 n=1 Tax=Nanorana parkeri TaxID=125878 RepID=UPI000854F324|nr:PREDICTED: OCIA domain-containing protein 1 [Nanorana parkeri]